MAQRYAAIEPKHAAFIARQHVFFTASAAATGHVNISPRGADALRVLGPNRVAYLDRTGSGNETAAHLLADGRLTIMLCAFDGPPLIMRLYGRGHTLRRGSTEYAQLLAAEYGDSEPLGARQMVVLEIDLVQTSCGYGVPLYAYEAERPQMDAWARAKGEDGIDAYWHEKNLVSMDGFPTGLLDRDEIAAE